VKARPRRSSPKRGGSADAIPLAVAAIRRLVRVLRLNAQRTQGVAGVSAAQLFVLEQLGAGQALSLNELAAHTLTDRSSVADVVDRLDADGLVERAVDVHDRRRAAVRITPKGRRVLARAPQAPTTALIAAIRSLAPPDRTALARSLTRLNVALGAAGEPATMLFADDNGMRSRRRRRSSKAAP